MTHLEEYNKIIEFRKSNQLPEDQYGENHHIVPRSVCPILKDSPDNIVRLSAQEHFLAHSHLWLAYRDELKEKKWAKSMCFAVFRMKRQALKSDNIEAFAAMYENARAESLKVLHYNRIGTHHSEETKKRMSASQKGKPKSIQQRLKISKSLKGRKSWKKGIPMREETKKKISESKKGQSAGMLWWNNGKECKRAKECPSGFVKGRIKRT